MNDNIIEYLQRWYLSKCDGAWEHEFGFDISTIDNPGWKINISGESNKNIIDIKEENSEDDWFYIKATDHEFKGYGGPGNLSTILDYARKWLA